MINRQLIVIPLFQCHRISIIITKWTVDVKEPNERAKGCKDAEIKVELFSFIGKK